jgi:uncharacterized protein (TIGR02444 family)
MGIAALEGPHWGWALGVYMTPGVSPACVVLQDEGGIDVNVMLIALHAAIGCGRAVGPTQITALIEASHPIRERVVRPLRAVRREMKDADYGATLESARDTVRGYVKAAEVASEQLELAMLAHIAQGWAPADGPATAEDIIAEVVRLSGGDHAAMVEQIAVVAAAARARG